MMKIVAVLALLVCGAAAVPLDQMTTREQASPCGVADAEDAVAARVHEIEMRFVDKVCSSAADPTEISFCPGGRKQIITLPTYVHVLTTDEGLGNVSDARILENIAIANDDFAGRPDNGNYTNTNFRFELVEIRREVNNAWAQLGVVTGPLYKSSLTVDPARNLNIYIATMNAGILGFAPFCFYGPEDSFIHGATVSPEAWVGGSVDNYNEGQTLVHEIGHHLGLFHAWQGGCNRQIGQQPDDICPQSTNSRGCPDPAPASCGDPDCPDNVHNHMDYSDDSCRWEFTQGQSDMVDYRISVWHPSYLDNAQREAIVVAGGASIWDEARAFQNEMATQGRGIFRQ